MGIKYIIILLFFAIINSNAQTEILNNVSNYMKNKFEYESMLVTLSPFRCSNTFARLISYDFIYQKFYCKHISKSLNE